MGQHELFENKSESFSTKKISDHIQVKRETVGDILKSFKLEKKVLGFYLTGHPVNEYHDEIESMSIKNINSYFKRLYKNSNDDFSEPATVCGVIINSRIQRMGQDRFINILTIDYSSHRL